MCEFVCAHACLYVYMCMHVCMCACMHVCTFYQCILYSEVRSMTRGFCIMVADWSLNADIVPSI